MSVGRAAVPVGAVGGIVMMLLGVLFFALNDTMGKWLLGTYAVGQLMLVRSISGLCVMAPAIHRSGSAGSAMHRAPTAAGESGLLDARSLALFLGRQHAAPG